MIENIDDDKYDDADEKYDTDNDFMFWVLTFVQHCL